MERIHMIVLIIIIGTGLLGGITNFLMSFDINFKKKECWIKFLASIFLSLCATITVPLFLQILSNDLLDKLSFKNALIFGGFCMIAAFFSKKFLEDLYLQIKNLEKKVQENAEETKKELKGAAVKTEAVVKKVEDIEESIEETDDIPTEIKQAIVSNNKFSLAEPEVQKIIHALLSNKYSFRTLDGIAKDTKIDVNVIKHVMETLRELGFAESKVGSTGQDFWRILKYPVRIYSASYGIPGYFADVTSKINELVSKNIYTGIASHTFFGIPDPAHGSGKILKIHCRIHGKEKELVFKEWDNFKIE